MRSKQPDSSAQTDSVDFVQATQAVVPGQSQDIVIGVNNATLYIPGDAVNLAGSISIFPREPNLFSPAGALDWSRSPVVNVEYRNGEGTPFPHITFSKPVQICFKISEELWQGFKQHPDQFQVQTYAEGQNPPRWEPLPFTSHADRFQLCGQTNHLSIFALAIRPQVVIPITGATPTLVQGYFTNQPKLESDGVHNGLNPTNIPIGVPTNVPPTQPPATEPPATQPPATQPPATQPPATQPPATQPPATQPPATQPPATEPPATQPPATQPPATQPPASEPPATQPPAVQPPATDPPAAPPATDVPTVP